MKFYSLLLATLILSGFANVAEARVATRSGDMFYDQSWIYPRPAVPSDATRRQDMFAPVPVFFHKNADMFRGVKFRYAAGRSDMFPYWRVPVPPPTILKLDPRPNVIERALYLYRPSSQP